MSSSNEREISCTENRKTPFPIRNRTAGRGRALRRAALSRTEKRFWWPYADRRDGRAPCSPPGVRGRATGPRWITALPKEPPPGVGEHAQNHHVIEDGLNAQIPAAVEIVRRGERAPTLPANPAFKAGPSSQTLTALHRSAR